MLISSVRSVVLGSFPQWQRSRPLSSASCRHVHCMAAGGHEFVFRLHDVQGTSGLLSPNSALCAQFLPNFSPPQACHLVHDFRGTPQRKHNIVCRSTLTISVLAERTLVSYKLVRWASANVCSGRNWSYLWNNKDVPAWAIVVMIAIFFIGVWGVLMGILIRTSSSSCKALCSYLQGMPKFTPGCCLSSLSVLDVLVGVKCTGEHPVSHTTFLGVATPVHTCQYFVFLRLQH